MWATIDKKSICTAFAVIPQVCDGLSYCIWLCGTYPTPNGQTPMPTTQIPTTLKPTTNSPTTTTTSNNNNNNQCCIAKQGYTDVYNTVCGFYSTNPNQCVGREQCQFICNTPFPTKKPTTNKPTTVTISDQFGCCFAKNSAYINLCSIYNGQSIICQNFHFYCFWDSCHNSNFPTIDTRPTHIPTLRPTMTTTTTTTTATTTTTRSGEF